MDQEEPATNTLIAAKSRGKLTNLSKDGQCLFVELENVFRFLFPSSVVNASPTVYIEKCVGNDTIQAVSTVSLILGYFIERRCVIRYYLIIF